MKTKNYQLILFAVLLVFLNLGSGLSSFAQGPGSSWLYYRAISLSPVTPSANFQVKVTLASGQYTHMKSDGSDLRFYDNSDVNCEYWIETWNTAGTSTIWVKVATSGAASLLMYYGNSSASAVTSGSSTFDFFDDFAGSALGANWTSDASGGSIAVSGGTVTLSNTNNGTVSISSPFTPASTSFFLETKHQEAKYNRNRFYATTSLGGGSPLAFDYGYFYNGSGAQNTANIFWNGWQTSSVNRNTYYLTRWQIADGSTYNFYTYNYSTGATVDSRTTTYGSNIRYITIMVTEVSGTSTIVDWVRLRKYTSSEPGSSVGSEVTIVPALSVAPSTLAFGYQATGTFSASKTFDLSGAYLTGYPGNITVTAPNTNFQVSNNNSTWGASTTIAYSSSFLNATPVYVRFSPQTTGAKSGNITFSGGGESTPPTVALTGTGSSTKTWNGGAANSWNTAANWSPSGVPGTGDAVIFNSPSTIAVSVNTTPATLSSVTISENSSVTFTSSGGQRIITLSKVGEALDIHAGSTLTLAGSTGIGTRSMDIVYSGTENTAQIDGTLNVTVTGDGSSYSATNSLTTVNGTLTKSGGTITSTSANLSFASGGTYNHAMNGGAIVTATWDESSVCLVSGITSTVPSGLGQTFGNFWWNCPGQSTAINFSGALTTVTGNFLLSGTNSQQLRLTGNTNLTLNVNKDFIISSGTLDFSNGTATTKVLNVGGSYNQTGGTFTNSTSNILTINFTGSGKTFTQSAGTLTNTYMNWDFNSGCTLALLNNLPVATGRTCIVNGILDLGVTTSVTGAGAFTLANGATIIIGSAASITSSGATGNVQVSGTRTFNNGGNYIFKGTAAQQTGTGLPTGPVTGDITIENANGVSLTNTSTTFSGKLTITNGWFDISTKSLTLGGGANTLIGSGSPVVATFKGNTSSNLTITGSGALGDPVSFNNSFAAGDFLNSFTLNRSSGTVTLASDLILGSGGLSLTTGVLTVLAGKRLDVQSGATSLGSAQCMILKSDATNGTASFIDNGTINGTGTAKIERYLTPYSGGEDWMFHFLSSPVGADQAIMPGFQTMTNYTDDFYMWKETTSEWINTKLGYNVPFTWNTAFGTGNGAFVAGKGYLVAYPSAVTKNFVGKPYSSTTGLTVNCTRTNAPGTDVSPGWNLIGNPFPSAVDWQYVVDNSLLSAGMDNALYYYDNSEPRYRYYIPLTGPLGPIGNGYSGGSQYIPAMQGVMVHVSSGSTSESVTFNNESRVHQGSSIYYKNTAPTIANVLNLSVEGNNNRDDARICFYNQATVNFDGSMDAFKLFGYSPTLPQLYSITADTTDLAINTLPLSEMNSIVKVGFTPGVAGNYTITAEGISSFPTNVKVILEDIKTGTFQVLNSNPVYSFNSAISDPANRFLLHFIEGNTSSTWTGNTNSDWFTDGNWSDGVPGANTAVTIPGGILPNYLTLASPASCASITINDGGTFIGAEFLNHGNAIVKRNIPDTKNYYFGSPIASTISVLSVFPGNPLNIWVREYNPAGTPATVWVYKNTTNPNIVPGRGYTVSSTISTGYTANFSGQLKKTDAVSPTLTTNAFGGFNMLGNPYPSAINWNQVIPFLGPGVSNTVKVWNGAGYYDWNGSVGNNPLMFSGLIPAEQGFFVTTTVTGSTITVPLTARTHGNPATYYKEAVSNVLYVNVDGNNYQDAAAIHFNNDAQTGLDNLDGVKLFGIEDCPQVYTLGANQEFSINELPMAGNETIDLGFKCNADGNYNFTAAGMESFDATTPILIEDMKLNTTQDLRANPVYSFNYATGENANRFKLHFKSANGINSTANSGISVYGNDHNVMINNTTSLAGEVWVYDMTGRELTHTTMNSQMTTSIPMQVAIGTYMVKVVTAKATVNQKVFIR